MSEASEKGTAQPPPERIRLVSYLNTSRRAEQRLTALEVVIGINALPAELGAASVHATHHSPTVATGRLSDLLEATLGMSRGASLTSGDASPIAIPLPRGAHTRVSVRGLDERRSALPVARVGSLAEALAVGWVMACLPLIVNLRVFSSVRYGKGNDRKS